MPEAYITIPTEKGSVHIAEDVLAAIAANAAAEVDGVAGMSGGAPELTEFIGGKKPASRGVHICVEDDEVQVNAAVLVRYGKNISGVADKVQRAVGSAVESMTGLKCVVNVHVAGVAFDK